MPKPKLLGIAGAPATGKTTLVTSLLSSRRRSRSFSVGKLKGEVYGDLAVLGFYPEGETFGGTDRLSMGVMPDAVTFLDALPLDGVGLVLFEGDRLVCRTFIDAAKPKSELRLVMLKASDDELEARQKARGNKQTPGWLKGRETKLRNLEAMYPFDVWESNRPRDLELNLRRLEGLVSGSRWATLPS